MLTGHHPFQYLPAYIELCYRRFEAFKAGEKLDETPYFMHFHDEDYYLLKLPEEIDVYCLDLL